jgi:hypothetical protein
VESKLIHEAKTRQIEFGQCVDSISATVRIPFPRDVSLLHENVIRDIVYEILPDFDKWIKQKKVELFGQNHKIAKPRVSQLLSLIEPIGSINSKKSELKLFVEWDETIAIVLEWVECGTSSSLSIFGDDNEW